MLWWTCSFLKVEDKLVTETIGWRLIVQLSLKKSVINFVYSFPHICRRILFIIVFVYFWFLFLSLNNTEASNLRVLFNNGAAYCSRSQLLLLFFFIQTLPFHNSQLVWSSYLHWTNCCQSAFRIWREKSQSGVLRCSLRLWWFLRWSLVSVM